MYFVYFQLLWEQKKQLGFNVESLEDNLVKRCVLF